MVFDLEKARRETPGCYNTVHLHNSGAALMPETVIDSVRQHLNLEMIRGGYEAEEEASEQLQNTYNSIAKMLNCQANEIALSESATVSWNSVFYGIAQTFRAGDRILTSRSDYVSNMIAYRQVAARYGVEVRVVPDDNHGQLDIRALESMINQCTKLISVTHVPTYNGLVNPINQIGEVASDYRIPYIVDACQSAGQMPLNVAQIGCDALSATGRKYLRGPRGTGFLYIREQSLHKFPPAVLDLHSATWTDSDNYELQSSARRYELFESSIANRLGLGAAVDYALAWGITDIYARIRFLANKLRDMLGEIDGVTLRDKGAEQCGIVTFSIEGVDPENFQHDMRRKNINVGLSKRNCAVIDLDDWGVNAIIRSSVHYYNTEEEIEYFIKEVERASHTAC